MRIQFDKLINEAKLEYPELSFEIDEIIGQTMSQCEIDNQPSDADLRDAEQYLNELIERTKKFKHTNWLTEGETEYERNL
jgi:hypothetical protein